MQFFHRMQRWCPRKAVISIYPACLSVLLWTIPAAAARNTPSEKQAQERTARKACLSGDYAQGVAILSDLFVSTLDPNYIFNQGRCFEQNRRYEDAIARFHEYLNTGEGRLGQVEIAAAEKHMADCKAMLEQERGTSPAAAAPQPAAQPSSAPQKAEPPLLPEPAPAIVTQPAPEAAPASPGRRLRIGGIIIASVGAAVTGAGILLNVKANSVADEMKSTVDGYSKHSERQRYETLSWVGYGVGMGCILTGAILYGMGWRASSASTSLALAPMVAPGQAGAVVTGAFP